MDYNAHNIISCLYEYLCGMKHAHFNGYMHSSCLQNIAFDITIERLVLIFKHLLFLTKGLDKQCWSYIIRLLPREQSD